MVRYETVTGERVPRAARRLTRRYGVMKSWYDQSRDKMIATLLYSDGKLIGWCAAIRVTFLGCRTRTFEISTYVYPKMRGKGYAQQLLNKTLKTLKLVEPNGKVRYGTPNDHGYFNNIYEKSIGASGLRPVKYFCA